MDTRIPLHAQAFRIQSPCGRAYEVPLDQVAEDYVRFLVDADGISRTEALGRVTQDAVESWFREQFSWGDVERYGRKTKDASRAQVIAALDQVRRGSSVSGVSRLVVDEAKVARERQAALDGALPGTAPSPRGPRL